MNVRALVCAFSLLAATSSTAFALPIAYTSEAAWLAAVTGVTTEDFGSSPLGSFVALTTDLGEFSVTMSANTNLHNQIVEVSGNRVLESTVSVLPNPAFGPTALTYGGFDAGPTIFGFAGDWFETANASDLTATINGVTFDFLTLLGGAPGDGFLGFVDPTGFSSISFGIVGSGNEAFLLDNAQIATGVSSEAMPEPATLLLFGTGLAAAGLRRYRRKP